MPERSPRFINVDELLPELDLERVAAYYGVPLPELNRIGEEIRTRCFLNCGRTEETGDRALAIKAEQPAKPWHCHQYGCGKGGNLVGLCDLLKPGESMGGRPRGKRFKEIAADLRAMVEGHSAPMVDTPAEPEPAPQTEPAVAERANVPLVRSDNERARALVNLDEKFVVDPAEMAPPAARYFRQRPFLTPEVCRKWRIGYLPRDAGGDRTGGTMRGRIVYPMLSEAGEVLTWFGRDPQYEERHRKWEAGGREGREPAKTHFVKGFERGRELFGQHAARLEEPGFRETLRETGLVVVEGPNDVIRLDALGVPAVGLCANTIAAAQTEKIARWAHQLAGGRVVLLFDCEPEGENGARQGLFELAQYCDVRLGWSQQTCDGRFCGRQPESLSPEEWKTLAAQFVDRRG